MCILQCLGYCPKSYVRVLTQSDTLTIAREKAAKALKEKGDTPEELLRSIKENEAVVAEAQRVVDAWKAIVGEKTRREEAAKAEAERIATEKAEAERKAAEERERAEKEEKARIEAEKKETERIAAEKAEEEARVEAERKAEEERIAKQKAEEKTEEAESDKEEAEKQMDDEEPKPVGSGVFGNIYNQFKGKVKEAFDFLMKHKGGDLLGVFHRKDVGDIDLVWGDENGGLAHILNKHVGEGKSFANVDEAMSHIQNIIGTGKNDFEDGDKIVFRKGSELVTVRKNFREGGKKIADKNWVLTAYDKEAADNGNRVTTKVIEGKATPHTASIDKGSEKPEKKQEKQSVFDKAKEIADKEEKKRKAEAEDDSVLGQATRAVGKKKKVNLFKYTASQKDAGEVIKGVHYANGYAYASDGYILFKEKADYPKEWEGTTRDKDGNLIDGKYPDAEKAIPRLVHIPDKEVESLPSKEVLDFAIAASKKLKGEAIPVAIDGLFFNAVNLKKFLEAVASKGMDKVVYRHPMLYATNGKDEIVLMPTVNTLEGALDIADRMESAGLPKEQIDAWKAHIEAADKKMSFDDFKKAVENAKKEGVRRTEAEKPKEQPLTEAERKDAEEVAGALGYRVEWVDTMEENGTIDADKKVIRIAKDAENPLVQVLGHEVAHGVKRMDGGKFKALQKAAKEVVGEKEWNERIGKKRGLNAYAEGKLAEEVTCDIVGEALNNKDALKRLAESLRGEKGILARLRDAVARMVEYFKNRGDKEGVRRMKAADKLLAEFESALKEGANERRLSPDTPIRLVNADADHGFKNYEEARAWAKENIARTYGNDETGGKGEIRISNTAIGKFLSEKAVGKSESKDVHLAVLRVLPDVIRESVDAEQHADYRKGADGKRGGNGVNPDVTMHILYGAVTIDGKTYRVKTTLKENVRDNEPTKAYTYEATKIELLAGPNEKATVSTFSRDSNNSITAAKLLKDVKKSYSNEEFFADENVERSVMEKGELTDAEVAEKERDIDHSVRSSKEMAEERLEIERKAKSDGTWLKAPNGKRTNLNERQWVDVRTKNFKEWFGDWENDPENASKIVDENGEPLMVFHYTPEDFTVFGEGKEIGASTFYNASDANYAATAAVGDWFTSKSDLPDYMGKPMRVFLNIKEPSDGRSLEVLADEVGYEISSKDYEAFDEDRDNTAPIIEAGKNYQEKLRDRGYDGIFIADEEFGGTSYITFAPNQIKSAVENDGSYSPKENDIRRSVREKKEDEKAELTAEERELRDNLVERMRKGGLDVVTDSEEMQRVIDTENERTRNMFVGEKGATEADKAEEVSTRLDNLSVARRMEEAEKDAKSIKMATGWERGTDGKWRYETSDIKPKPFEEWMNKKNLKLGDIIDSDSGLFEMYPELKDFKVTRGKGKSTNAAIYTGLGKIEINFSKFKPYMSIPSNREKINGILHRVINHEIQHAIQDSEGFAQGVSPNAFRPDAPIGKLREMEEADGRMVERYNAMSYTEKALGEGVRLKERILENRKEYNALASKYRFGMDGYTRAAGEVEARNTEKRIGMTEEERRASLASETEDVAREDQILLGVDNADGEQRFLRTAGGEVYGLVKDGRIYLDPKVATAETAVHEYTHLWGDMLRRKDSEQWSRTVKELKNSVLWEEVKESYPELKTDDEIADEVLSTFSGRRGAERLREEARRVADGEGGVFTKAKAIETLERVKEAIARFWEGVARMFGINRYRSAEELADMAMRDLINGVKPTSRTFTFDNFYKDTKAVFEGTERPKGKPDYTSYSGSEYWYGEDNGGKYVVRGSDHWSGKFKVKDGERTNVGRNHYSEITEDGMLPIGAQGSLKFGWEKGLSKPVGSGISAAIDRRGSGDSNNIASCYWYIDNAKEKDNKGFTYGKAYLSEFEDKERRRDIPGDDWRDIQGLEGGTRAMAERIAEQPVEEINNRFNEELEKYQNNELPKGHRFELGMPSAELQSAGFPTLPISMRSSLLAKKAGAERHPFAPTDLRDLVNAIQKPIAIFNYSKNNMRNLIVDVSRGGKHFLVGVTLNYKADNIEINSVSGLFPKENHEWIKWIQDGKVLRIDQKEKVQDLINSLRTNPAESERIGLNLDDVAKKVKDFENPKLFDGKISEVDKKGSDSTDRSVRENPKNEDKPRYSRKPGESIFDYASRVSEDVDRSVRERVSARDEYEKKVKSKGFQTKEALQNSMLGLQEFMLAIDHASGNRRYIEDIPDFENPILGENRLSSVNKEEMHQVAKTQFKPLMSAVAKLSGNGKESGELYDYMFAKHGLERDAVMRQREAQKEFDKYQKANPKGTKTIGDFVASLEGKDYAGLTALTAEDGRVKSIQSQIDAINEQMKATDDQLLLRKLGGQKKRLKVDLLNSARDAADDIRKAFENNPSHDRSDINELWSRVNEVNGNTLRKLYESGMLTKEAYNDISSMYTNYIPMRGFDQTTSADAYAYLTHGDSAFNAPIKTAKGRSSKADNPIAYMQAMAESAIMQGNRNVLVKQKMLNFVRNHPSDLASVSDVWLQYDSVADEWKPFYAFGRESKG